MGPYPRQEPHISYLIQSLIVFGAVTALVSLTHGIGSTLASILIPALWGLGALIPGWKGEFPPPVLGLTQPLFLRGLKLYIWSSAVFFTLYAAVFYASQRYGFPVPAETASAGVPILRIIIYNLVVVAFFEELFFRGYLQDRFDEASRHLFTGIQLKFWIPIVGTSFLFGATHVAVALDPARMVVFFPGLLFGWLKARTGSLIAPVLSHATANVIFEMLIRWVG